MPAPTPQDTHVDGLLTNMSIMSVQDSEGYVADEIAPRLDVKKQSDKYAVWSKSDFYRMAMEKVGDGDPAPIAGFDVDTSNNYFADFWKIKKLLTDQQRANYDVPLNADQATVNYLTQQGLMRRDYEVLNTLFISGVWTTEYDGAASPTGSEFYYWNDYTQSHPFQNVRAWSTVVKKLTGRRPNKLVVGPEVNDALMEHPDILDKIKHTQTGIATEELLAAAFGVKKYLVADAVYNSAAEKATESATMAHIAGKHALLSYVPDSPSIDEPSAAYNFTWTQFDQVKDGGASIRRWREDDPEGDWMLASMAFDPKVTSADCGLFANGAVS